jgi:uncharacterized protein with HEPN domain
MSKRDIQLLLEDILDAINKIINYTQGMTFETFELETKL